MRQVGIPKDNGNGMRLLGVLTALDRFIQPAIVQVVSAQWEPHFHPRSYGFAGSARPTRPCGNCGRTSVKATASRGSRLKLKVADKAIDKLKDRVRELPVVHEAAV
jgi:hypothetical protein